MDGAERATTRPDGSAGGEPMGRPPRRVTEPVAVDTARIVVAGLAGWAVALVVVLAVPALHGGSRNWWPWVCVAGLVLGGLGLGYVRRGRGNAAGARRG